MIVTRANLEELLAAMRACDAASVSFGENTAVLYRVKEEWICAAGYATTVPKEYAAMREAKRLLALYVEEHRRRDNDEHHACPMCLAAQRVFKGFEL
jgi:hypothetical protein